MGVKKIDWTQDFSLGLFAFSEVASTKAAVVVGRTELTNCPVTIVFSRANTEMTIGTRALSVAFTAVSNISICLRQHLGF